MTQRLNYNVSGQTLTHVPGTRQASIAWRLEDLRYEVGDSSRLLQSGTAAVDTATQVTTAAAGPGQPNPRLLTMADTTGFVAGVIYEVSGTGGVEALEVAAVTTNVSLSTTLPLIGTYPSGSTVQGRTHTTAAIDDAVLLDADRVDGDWPMRIVWVYADGSQFQEQVRLVHDTDSDLFLAAIVADCRRVFPDLDTRMEYHGRDVLTPHVDATIRQIRADALEKGLLPEKWLAGDQGHWSAVYRTLLHLAQLGNVPANVAPRDYVAYLQAEYEKRWKGLTSGWGRAEVLEQDRETGVATSSDGTSYRPLWRDM